MQVNNGLKHAHTNTIQQKQCCDGSKHLTMQDRVRVVKHAHMDSSSSNLSYVLIQAAAKLLHLLQANATQTMDAWDTTKSNLVAGVLSCFLPNISSLLSYFCRQPDTFHKQTIVLTNCLLFSCLVTVCADEAVNYINPYLFLTCDELDNCSVN